VEEFKKRPSFSASESLDKLYEKKGESRTLKESIELYLKP